MSDALIIPPDQGDSYWTLGDLITFKVGPRHTNNAWSIAESTVMPGGGPPPHVHTREDETFLILDGEVLMMLENDLFTGKPGDAFFLPRGKVHTFHNPSKTAPAKMLVMASPCGFEKFMSNFARPKAESVDPPPVRKEDIDRLIATAPQFGIEIRFDHKPTGAPASVQTTRYSLWVFGNRVDLHLLGTDTSNAFTFATIYPSSAGVPLHRHVEMDELFYVMSGCANFTLGDESFLAEPGTTIFAPRGTMHGFKSAGGTPARIANFHFPGGFESFFLELGSPRTSENPPQTPIDFDHAMNIFRKHGMEMPS